MRTITARIIAIGAIPCLISSVLVAQVNGLHTSTRISNGFPASTLAITNSNSIPGSVSISDSLYGMGSGTNRDDILLSEDHGATPQVFGIDQGFTIFATITLSAGSNAPRKEAGLRINSVVAGDAIFLIDTDAGDIDAFGAGAPFESIGSNGGGNGYVPGTPISLGETYTPGLGGTTGANPGTLTYFVNYPTRGINASFGGPYSNFEGGPTNYQVGLYATTDGVSSPTTDFLNATFSNITTVVPEPTSLAMIAMGGLSLLVRRPRLPGAEKVTGAEKRARRTPATLRVSA